MSVEYFVCDNCEDSCADCSWYAISCECGGRFCSSKCAEQIDETCKLCRLEIVRDNDLLAFVLKRADITVEQAITLYRDSKAEKHELCKICQKSECLGIGRPGHRDGQRCSGTIDTECDGYPLSEERLNEIVEYQLECLYWNREGLPLNGRFLLSLIKEVRELRHGK